MDIFRIIAAITILASSTERPALVPIQDGGIIELEIHGAVDDALYKYLSGNINRPGVKLVFISINSPGGELKAAVDIVGLFKSAPAKIICRDEEMAASAAMVIFQACNVRTMERGAKMLAHGVKFGMQKGAMVGHKDAMAMAEALHELNMMCVDSMLGRTNVSPLLALQLFDEGIDITIDSAMAVQMGAVDVILPEQL